MKLHNYNFMLNKATNVEHYSLIDLIQISLDFNSTLKTEI